MYVHTIMTIRSNPYTAWGGGYHCYINTINTIKSTNQSNQISQSINRLTNRWCVAYRLHYVIPTLPTVQVGSSGRGSGWWPSSAPLQTSSGQMLSLLPAGGLSPEHLRGVARGVARGWGRHKVSEPTSPCPPN